MAAAIERKRVPKWRKAHNAKYDVKWRGTVKVQRSLWTTAEAQQVLIYSRDHSVELTAPIDDQIVGWFGAPGEEDEHKFFATAELRGTVIHLIRKTEWREW